MVQLDFKDPRTFRFSTCVSRLPWCLSQCVQANCSSPRCQLLTIPYPKMVREGKKGGMGGKKERRRERKWKRKRGRERRRKGGRDFPNVPFSFGEKKYFQRSPGWLPLRSQNQVWVTWPCLDQSPTKGNRQQWLAHSNHDFPLELYRGGYPPKSTGRVEQWTKSRLFQEEGTVCAFMWTKRKVIKMYNPNTISHIKQIT